jgi:8-oxo-dGTP diphosphatase
MPYTPILATLGYILSPDKAQVLLIHRNARPDDPALGKYNGLGGKLEKDENIFSGMTREIEEEAGICVTQMHLRGTISWPGFGKNGEDWFGFIFLITAFTGTPQTKNAEGELSWQPIDRVKDAKLPFWEGDKHFLPLVFDTDTRPFHGVMPYQNGSPVSWDYNR